MRDQNPPNAGLYSHILPQIYYIIESVVKYFSFGSSFDNMYVLKQCKIMEFLYFLVKCAIFPSSFKSYIWKLFFLDANCQFMSPALWAGNYKRRLLALNLIIIHDRMILLNECILFEFFITVATYVSMSWLMNCLLNLLQNSKSNA